MKKGALAYWMTFTASLAFGQLDSNSITVGASRNTSLQADQAVFGVFVQSGLSTGLDDVLAALQGSGITIANFSGVGELYAQPIVTQQPPPTLQWAFALSVPLSKTKDTVASLTTLQQTLAHAQNALALSFSIQGTQVSAQLLQSQTCSVPDLISDAQAQAQKLAAAAGVTLGAILAMSSATSNVVSSPPPLVFAGPGFFSTGSFGAASGALPPCSVTVKFAVTRFQ